MRDIVVGLHLGENFVDELNRQMVLRTFFVPNAVYAAKVAQIGQLKNQFNSEYHMHP